MLGRKELGPRCTAVLKYTAQDNIPTSPPHHQISYSHFVFRTMPHDGAWAVVARGRQEWQCRASEVYTTAILVLGRTRDGTKKRSHESRSILIFHALYCASLGQAALVTSACHLPGLPFHVIFHLSPSFSTLVTFCRLFDFSQQSSRLRLLFPFLSGLASSQDLPQTPKRLLASFQST